MKSILTKGDLLDSYKIFTSLGKVSGYDFTMVRESKMARIQRGGDMRGGG